MPEAELRRNLISLSTKRHQILIKASKQRGVADDDTFTFNPDFTVRLFLLLVVWGDRDAAALLPVPSPPSRPPSYFTIKQTNEPTKPNRAS